LPLNRLMRLDVFSITDRGASAAQHFVGAASGGAPEREQPFPRTIVSPPHLGRSADQHASSSIEAPSRDTFGPI
jgi:hypothetical protein